MKKRRTPGRVVRLVAEAWRAERPQVPLLLHPLKVFTVVVTEVDVAFRVPPFVAVTVKA
jgi:hypothetical protein